jgi:hypothetical protein
VLALLVLAGAVVGWLLPPNPAFHCDFVARHAAVKTSYPLWVSANEKRAMAAVLGHC